MKYSQESKQMAKHPILIFFSKNIYCSGLSCFLLPGAFASRYIARPSSSLPDISGYPGATWPDMYLPAAGLYVAFASIKFISNFGCVFKYFKNTLQKSLSGEELVFRFLMGLDNT